MTIRSWLRPKFNCAVRGVSFFIFGNIVLAFLVLIVAVPVLMFYFKCWWNERPVTFMGAVNHELNNLMVI
jgi:hypothetical protein